MKLLWTKRARRDYRALPPKIQALADKQLDFLITDIRYPSLHAKKYDEKNDVRQGRITRDYRFYFLIETGNYVILSLIKHPK